MDILILKMSKNLSKFFWNSLFTVNKMSKINKKKKKKIVKKK